MVRRQIETTVLKEEFITYNSQVEGTPDYAGPHGEAPEFVRRQKQQEESMAQSLYCGFWEREWAGKGRQA